MYILNTKRQKVQLVRLDTEVMEDPATGRAAVAVAVRRGRDPVNTSALVARACRAFFGIGGQQQPGKAAAIPEQVGPPPTAFRETASNLLHVVYREIVVRFQHATPQNRRQAILRDKGFEVRRETPFVPDQVVVYDPERRYSGEELVEISNGWMELDEVLFSTPNFVSQFLRQVPPSIRSEEWHLRNKGTGGAKKGEDVNVSPAWKMTRGQNIVVAVLDDGIDIDHPNLKGNIWKNPSTTAQDVNGRDFFVPADNPEHFNPRPKRFTFPFDQLAGNDIHGTPCAGIIAAAGKSGSVGVAPGCRILPVKIFHADDLASGENVANAIRYAALHADILSCSWSGGFNPDIEQALEDAGQLGRAGRGAAVFCAAGNESGSPVGFPARDPNAIAVGASTDEGERASYSNVGPQISLAAPSSGGTRGIFTTDVSLPNRGFNVGLAAAGGANGRHTNSFGGTSAATPLAAGVGALVLSVNPNLSRSDLRDLLQQTADRIGPDHDAAGHSDQFGFGRVNAGKAVAQAQALLPS